MFPFELDDALFNKFKDLIYAEAGIKLSDLKKALVQARLARRLRHLGIGTYAEYYTFLTHNYENEKIHFINAITTNKTDFFRENRHFEYMREVCLPEFENTGKRRIKIWSAGCSTGEEAYSISMTMKDYNEKNRTIEYKILATDIDTNVLDTAAGGVYPADRISEIDVATLKKYFYRGSGENEGLFKVKEAVRENVFFRRLNLLDESFPMKGKFDIIFCRNVIIYFDKSSQKTLFEHIWHYLEDHGYLFIGHSENITALTDRFSLIGHTMYRKNVPAAASGV